MKAVKKENLARQNLSCLQQAVYLAKKVGQGLG